jgi:tight adherence protein C
MAPLLLGLATFVSLTLLVAGAAWVARTWSAPMLARLRALGKTAEAGGQVAVLADDRPKGPLERFLTQLGQHQQAGAEAPEEAGPKVVKQEKPRADIRQYLVQAGIRRPNALALLMGIRVALGACLALLGLLLGTIVSPTFLPMGFALGVVGFVLPRFVVARMAAKRRDKIQQHLPDAIDLLLLCIEAGLGLNAALVKVAEERSASGRDPIGQELTQLAKELQVGVTRKEAFRNLADRTGAGELRSLAAHLIHAERFGSSIGATLRVQSETMRTHRRLAAEEAANKTQIKLLFPLILFIFPSVMIVILLPAVMRLMEALSVLM